MLLLALAVGDLLLFTAAFWVTGRACAHLAARVWPSGAGFADEVALGMGVWMAYVFALAAAGLLSVAALVTPLIAAGLAAVLTLAVRRPWRTAVSRWRPTPSGLLWAACLAAVLGVLFVYATYPSLAWDAAVYHLAMPKRMLAAGGLTRIPLNFQSLWPLDMELLFTVALAWRGPQLAAALQWGCGVLLLADMARVARGAGLRPASTAAAVAIFLASPVVLEQMGIAYVDLAFTLFFWLAFAALRRALSGEDAGRNLVLAGVFLGLLSGIKLTGVLACASLAALWLGTGLARGRAFGRPTVAGGLFRLAIPVVLLLLPWHVRLWRVTGNPVYPFAYARFGGIEWSPRLVEQLAAYRDSTGFGRTARDYLLLPARLVLAPNLRRAATAEPSWLVPARGFLGFDGELGRVWLLAVPLALFALFAGRRQPTAAIAQRRQPTAAIAQRRQPTAAIAQRRQPTAAIARAAAGAAVVYLAGWSLLSQHMRFVVPVLPLLAVAAGCGVDELLARARGRAARWGAAAVLCAASLLLLAAARGDAAAARRKLATMVSVGPDLAERLVPPVFRYLDAATPADARVLFVNTNKGYYCDRDYLADAVFEASQVADWLRSAADVESVGRLLRAARVTHVLFERVDWGIDYPESFAAWLRDPQRAAPVFRSDDGRFTVLEVR